MNINEDQLKKIEDALMLSANWDDALAVVKEVRDNIADDKLLAKAREEYANDDVEIDEGAGTSLHDEGCWVQAWVHLRKPECPCREDGVVDPTTGVIDCTKCMGSGFLDWDEE